jgi:hypothetical protein
METHLDEHYYIADITSRNFKKQLAVNRIRHTVKR